jgi:urease accessory protein
MFDVASSPNLIGEAKSFDPPVGLGRRPSDRDLQRANGSGRVVLSGSGGGNQIVDLFQRSPIRFMFPTTDSGAIKEAVLINTAGGVAGGDRYESAVTALADAAIVVTSQAAEKIYSALDEPAHIATRLKACKGAKLAWLPQETIIFNWARLNRETEIDVCSGAELLALEWLIFGRAAHGEELLGGEIKDSWRVKRDGQLVWADCFRATAEIFPHLRRKALLANFKAIGTLIYFGPINGDLELLHGILLTLDCYCAATTVGDLTIIRFAAAVSYDLRLALRNFLRRFGETLGPGPFRVPKMWMC